MRCSSGRNIVKSMALEGFLSVLWLFWAISCTEQVHSRRRVTSREHQEG